MLQINKGWKSKCCRNVNKIGFILNIVDLKPNIFSVDNLLRSEKQNLSYVILQLDVTFQDSKYGMGATAIILIINFKLCAIKNDLI